MPTLKSIRLARGFTQSALAQMANIPRENIARYESGTRRPSPEVAERIALALDLDVPTMWQVLYGSRKEANA